MTSLDERLKELATGAYVQARDLRQIGGGPVRWEISYVRPHTEHQLLVHIDAQSGAVLRYERRGDGPPAP